MQIRRSGERGHAQHGWLDSFHTFSFADYNDPKHMGFRALRVINEDRVAPGQGFGQHGHRDMEIVTYVLEGALEHKDSMGNGSVMRPGDVQRMSAGTGVMHSEFNASKSEPVHFLQIWIQPDKSGHQPGYEQKTFGDDRRGKLRLIASPDGRDGSVRIHQNASMFGSLLTAGEKVTHDLQAGRGAWVHVVRGSVTIRGAELATGDAVSFVEPGAIECVAKTDAEVILFDLA
jgi:redox-sensitive bicupin YhaK (pirin superfamily)